MQSTVELLSAPRVSIPQGQYYLLTPGMFWLHVLADALIALLCFSIPVSLARFLSKRWDPDCRWVFLCFGLFMLAVGTTHLLEIWNVWHADYWLAGFVKALMAAVSLPTAYFVVKLLPVALSLPSPAALRRVNAELCAEVALRKLAEANLSVLTVELDARVAARTAELLASNAQLQQQVMERDAAHEALRASEEVFSKAFMLYPDGMLIVRLADLSVIRANEALGGLWGSAPEAIAGKLTMEFAPGNSEQERSAFMVMLRARGECLDYDSTMRMRDGRLVPFIVSVRTVTFNDEACAMIMVRDITKRRSAEAAAAQLSAGRKQLYRETGGLRGLLPGRAGSRPLLVRP